MMRVKRVEVINPPITTVAKGRCTSAPAEAETAIGKNPSTSVSAVKRIGLILLLVPRRIRSPRSFTPSAFNSFNPLIRTSPFKTATPKSTIKPTPAEILKGIPRNQSANTPPMAANGMAI